MPTFKLRANELTGETGLTVQLFPPGGTIANGAGGDSLSESSGLFSATVAESLSGFHQYYVYQSGNPIYSGFVYCNGSTWYADQPSEGTTYPPLYRSADDTQDIRFLWPVDDDTITATVSINGATPVAVSGAITQTALTANGQYFYELAYDADDRPTAQGSAFYTFSGTGYTGYLTLEQGASMPTILPVAGRVTSAASASYIAIKTSEAVTVTVGLTNTDGTAMSTVGMSLELVFESGSTEVVIGNSDITKSSSGFSFTVPSSLNSAERLWSYVCRKTTDEAVLCSGKLEVVYAPNN